jgi:hypothetical protein
MRQRTAWLLALFWALLPLAAPAEDCARLRSWPTAQLSGRNVESFGRRNARTLPVWTVRLGLSAGLLNHNAGIHV